VVVSLFTVEKRPGHQGRGMVISSYQCSKFIAHRHICDKNRMHIHGIMDSKFGVSASATLAARIVVF